jgi:hypothetical protein
MLLGNIGIVGKIVARKPVLRLERAAGGKIPTSSSELAFDARVPVMTIHVSPIKAVSRDRMNGGEYDRREKGDDAKNLSKASSTTLHNGKLLPRKLHCAAKRERNKKKVKSTTFTELHVILEKDSF